MFDKLTTLGYRRLVASDHYAPETLANLSSIIGRPVPEEFIRFLEEFPNTGTFEQFVDALGLEAAPRVPDKRYPIGVMYAYCSKSHSDLSIIRKIVQECGTTFSSLATMISPIHLLSL